MNAEETELPEVDSITADLATAWDAAEGDSDGAESEGGSVHESYSESSSAQGEGYGSGSAASDTDLSDEDSLRADENGHGGVNQVAEEHAQHSLETPPQGLSPEAREAWAEVPDAVKADIAKREADYEKGIEKHRANTQRVQAMDRSLQPYAQLFAMNGGPGQTLPGLLQTASLLQMGSAPQKAETVANIIKQFGVDIKTLDSLLVGEAPPPEVQQQNAVQQQVQAALKPYQQHMAQIQQQQQYAAQQAQGQVAQEVNDFGSQHEFYNDVRSDMADLLDMAANRGRQMSLEEAYNTACAAHPQISKVMANRKSAEQVANKRQAATSIQGSPGGAMGGAQSGSIAQALNDAWDGVGRM